MANTKRCQKCGLRKPIGAFDRNGAGHRSHCKKCRSEYMRDYYARNKSKRLKAARRYYRDNRELVKARASSYRQRAEVRGELAHKNRRRMYGITKDEWTALLRSQKGRCAICRKLPTRDRIGRETLHVDHDHKTGRIRGLLCSYCNRGLAAFHDKPKLLTNAAAYLEGSNRARRNTNTA